LTHPPIKYYEPEEDVVSRKQATKYINKLIQLKIIKSDKQVFGSYLRGNKFIGDLDIFIDKQEKDKVIKILQKHVKNLK
jgi:predicted nucleotidyltransferase